MKSCEKSNHANDTGTADVGYGRKATTVYSGQGADIVMQSSARRQGYPKPRHLQVCCPKTFGFPSPFGLNRLDLNRWFCLPRYGTVSGQQVDPCATRILQIRVWIINHAATLLSQGEKLLQTTQREPGPNLLRRIVSNIGQTAKLRVGICVWIVFITKQPAKT